MKRAKVFLSRRNVLTLLSKLERRALGEATACTLIKNDNQHPVYAQTMAQVAVSADAAEQWYEVDHSGHEVCLSKTSLEGLRDSLRPGSEHSTFIVSIASVDGKHVDVSIVEDAVYYADRAPGVVHPSDTP